MGKYQRELRNKNRGYMNLKFNALHYEVENRLLRLIEKLAEKRDKEDWIARISEDPSEYDASPITPLLHHSITPPLRIHA